MRKATFATLSVIAITGLCPAAVVPADAPVRMQDREVVALVKQEIKRLGLVGKYSIGQKSTYDAKSGIYWLRHDQIGPLRTIDGDMIGIVNAVDRKTCIQQAMRPPYPCT